MSIGDEIMSSLIIVESPAKAKTIEKYLGKGYQVIASMGHVRDLPKSTIGVDFENNFTPKYITIKGKGDLVKKLKLAAKKSDKVYLATDPDREGEAISWHLAHILGLDTLEKNRITFNEITKTGVKYGMSHPRVIDQDLVDAQQARRILDRIVGYKLSPFLWQKVKKGLSAGRVQSVAVRLIVDREREITAFKVEEYWSIDAKLKADTAKKTFGAKLTHQDGKKIEVKNEQEANVILDAVKLEKFSVSNVKKGVKKKNPAAPFTTSTLQQDASRKLGFQSKRTMKVAQELYEGITIKGSGAVGLITYMRTDSLRISDEAVEQASQYIKTKYGEAYLSAEKRVYKSKKNSQDGHEAIRPTMIHLAPADIKSSLTSDQYKLYKIIWERFIACQMSSALLDTVQIDITAGNRYLFKSSGFTVKFDGFTVLYEEGKDVEDEKAELLPELTQGQALKVEDVLGNQHFTQPPSRFTEASLIKSLEENGIGRPSTYAPTITTIIQRDYITREAKALKPTLLGEITTKLMEEQFSNIVNAEFTANMEEKLDKIEEGDGSWKDTLAVFYEEFSTSLATAEKNMEGTKIAVPEEETDEICELCGKNMIIKSGRFGKFLACPGFPECKNTKRIVEETKGKCPLCGLKILAKKSKKGKVFFGCENNPTCEFMSWDKPTDEVCPKCSSSLFKKMGKYGKTHCLKADCGYEKPKE